MSDRLRGYVGVTYGWRDHAVLTLEEWLASPEDEWVDVVYLPTLRQMLAWSDQVGHRIAPRPVPDERQIARIAEMLTRNG